MTEKESTPKKFGNMKHMVNNKRRTETTWAADDELGDIGETPKSDTVAQKEHPETKSVSSDETRNEQSKERVLQDTETAKPEQEDVKDPYYEPTKSAKLSEDVLTKVKILMPFIQREHGFDLRANNSFIDVMIDYFIENGLDESDRALFMDYYEASINNRK